MLGKRGHKGVNLIELLVTLAVVAILAVIAAPSFTNVIQESRVNGAAQSLYYALQYARSAAIKSNQTVYVNFSTGSNWCYGINSGSACNCNTPSSCNLGSGKAPSSSPLTLSATGLSSSSLSFEGTRGATGNSSTLTYTVTGQTTAVEIVISILGNMYLCSNQISGYTACP